VNNYTNECGCQKRRRQRSVLGRLRRRRSTVFDPAGRGWRRRRSAYSRRSPATAMRGRAGVDGGGDCGRSPPPPPTTTAALSAVKSLSVGGNRLVGRSEAGFVRCEIEPAMFWLSRGILRTRPDLDVLRWAGHFQVEGPSGRQGWRIES